jgi:hypothetical protein
LVDTATAPQDGLQKVEGDQLRRSERHGIGEVRVRPVLAAGD